MATEPTYTRSRIHPEIVGHNADEARAIEFMDANRQVYDIITGDKSRAFGAKAPGHSERIGGWADREDRAVIRRLTRFYQAATGHGQWRDKWTICNDSALFSLEHFNDEGFTGGFFQAHDTFPRECITLDYTAETLPAIVRAFFGWAGNDDTQKITIDHKAVDAELWR